MVIAPLNRKEIKLHPERVSNIKPFISKYNWDGTKYPSKKKDWKRFEQNNSTIVVNVLYVKEMKICHTCISNINSN